MVQQTWRKNKNFVQQDIFSKTNPLTNLNDIHNQFVIIPIDKANGNVAFSFQQFYALCCHERTELRSQ